MPEPTADNASASKTATTSQSGAAPRFTGTGGSDRSRTIAIAALVLAILAVALGAYAALRTTGSDSSNEPGAAGSYDQAQQDEAKATICSAFDTVRDGVGLNTNASAPGGPEDLTGTLAVAANARLSLLGGGQYLLARLEPATPADFAEEVRVFADKLLDIGAAAVAGTQTTDPVQATRLKDAQEMSVSIAEKCTAS